MHPKSEQLITYLRRLAKNVGHLIELVDSESDCREFLVRFLATSTEVAITNSGIDIRRGRDSQFLNWQCVEREKLERPSILDLRDATYNKRSQLMRASFGSGMEGWSDFRAPGFLVIALWVCLMESKDGADRGQEGEEDTS